ncbi:MAG: DNRLRE domain-containing protein, partial [Actinobacteria bacterium]|nr:DNRLRE domain-containing protein [Actinomycetota bacterium]
MKYSLTTALEQDPSARRGNRPLGLTLLRLTLLLAVGLAALGGFLQAAPRGYAAVDAGAGGTADSGYRDFSFGATTTAPTAKDQQSKLWFNDGLWWGSLFNSSTLKYHIYKLNAATQVWSDTGTVIDERDGSRSDTLWDGTRLYVVTHGLTATTPGHSIRLLRFTYDSSAKTYSTDAGFPVTLNTGGTQAATIDKDTTGRLWVTYTQTSKVYITHSTTSDGTWGTPYVLPVDDTTNILDQDESAVVSFNGKIGVMWSNQNATEWAYYFATHVDGAADTAWTKTTAHQGSEESDNHLNVKSLDGDPAGQVFAAVKTSLNAADAPLYYLLVLRNDGTWTKQTFATVADDHTRAQVALDPVNRRLYMFGTSPCCSGGSIYYKDTSLDSPSFVSGKGTPLIQNATDTHINNPSTTKQSLTTDTELVVEASDDTSDFYVHATIDIGPDVTPPDTTINSGPSGTVGTADATFTFSANEGESTFACSLDGAGFASCTSPKAYTGLVDGSHTFEVRATDPVGNIDPSPASRTWTVDTTTQALTFPAAADTFVEQGKPTTNFGTNGLLVADDSPNTETFIRFAPSGVTGAVVEAKLRLFVTNGTNNGPALYRSDAAWSETGVTWNTRPPTLGGVIEDKGAIPNRTWTEYDVKSVVTGNGTYSFRIDPTSTDGVDFYSRDSTNASKPQLVLTVDNDTIAPQTTIDSGPSGTVGSTSATFTFSSNEPGAGFRCSLDGAAYSSCTSPRLYSGLGQGPHTFGVKAVDLAGNEDLTPATRGWSIDATAPAAPVITSPLDNSTNTTGSITASGTAEPGTSVQILDGAELAGTSTADSAGSWTATFTGVADGSHTYAATATDAAGNTSPASNARTVTVDSTVPETTIDSGPTGVVSTRTATFTFSSSEPGASFQCKLDGGAYAPCTSTQTYNALGEGSHSFDVRAT